MQDKILQRFATLVRTNKIPDQGFVGIDDNWHTVDINKEWITYECAGGENELPEGEPIYIEDIEEVCEQMKKEQEEEDRINDAEYELINESDVEEEWEEVN